MWYEAWYKVDDWEDEIDDDYDEYDRRDIYRERIATSAAPPRNDGENEPQRNKGPPDGRRGERAPVGLKNKYKQRELCACRWGCAPRFSGFQSQNYKQNKNLQFYTLRFWVSAKPLRQKNDRVLPQG